MNKNHFYFATLIGIILSINQVLMLLFYKDDSYFGNVQAMLICLIIQILHSIRMFFIGLKNRRKVIILISFYFIGLLLDFLLFVFSFSEMDAKNIPFAFFMELLCIIPILLSVYLIIITYLFSIEKVQLKENPASQQFKLQ